jgi:hypothetical protein
VNISANFRKNLKWPKCYFQGLGGRWFMKKTWSKKSLDTVPLNGVWVGTLQKIKTFKDSRQKIILTMWQVFPQNLADIKIYAKFE